MENNEPAAPESSDGPPSSDDSNALHNSLARAAVPNDIIRLEEGVRHELAIYREKGKLIRNLGTGSAVAGGAASLLPLASLLGPLGLIGGIAGAAYAVVKQQERDEQIYRWENRLRSLAQHDDIDARRDELLILFGEVRNANA